MTIQWRNLLLTAIICCLELLFLITPPSQAQPPQTEQPIAICKDKFYQTAFDEITAMLDGKAELSVKRSVFLLEWAFLQGQSDYTVYCQQIAKIADELKAFMRLNNLNEHPIGGNMALFEFFTNDNPLNGYKSYMYDFDDYMGKNDFTKMFVTKLMRTHSGQCRSLPLFYKILANEIGAEAYIAYAPMHSFIRHHNEDGSKLINVELTNHSMPREVFIIERNGVTQRAIETGAYMKPCDDREIIIQLLVELTYSYERLYSADSFVERCIKTVLRYDPNNLPAWMRVADKLYCDGVAYQQELRRKGLPEDKWSLNNYAQYQVAKKKISDLGYVETSPEMYDAWMKDIQNEIERRKQTATNH